jgi:hypothetical protein
MRGLAEYRQKDSADSGDSRCPRCWRPSMEITRQTARQLPLAAITGAKRFAQNPQDGEADKSAACEKKSPKSEALSW